MIPIGSIPTNLGKSCTRQERSFQGLAEETRKGQYSNIDGWMAGTQGKYLPRQSSWVGGVLSPFTPSPLRT